MQEVFIIMVSLLFFGDFAISILAPSHRKTVHPVMIVVRMLAMWALVICLFVVAKKISDRNQELVRQRDGKCPEYELINVPVYKQKQ